VAVRAGAGDNRVSGVVGGASDAKRQVVDAGATRSPGDDGKGLGPAKGPRVRGGAAGYEGLREVGQGGVFAVVDVAVRALQTTEAAVPVGSQGDEVGVAIFCGTRIATNRVGVGAGVEMIVELDNEIEVGRCGARVLAHEADRGLVFSTGRDDGGGVDGVAPAGVLYQVEPKLRTRDCGRPAQAPGVEQS